MVLHGREATREDPSEVLHALPRARAQPRCIVVAHPAHPTRIRPLLWRRRQRRSFWTIRLQDREMRYAGRLANGDAIDLRGRAIEVENNLGFGMETLHVLDEAKRILDFAFGVLGPAKNK